MSNTPTQTASFFRKPAFIFSSVLVLTLGLFFVTTKANSKKHTRINPAFASYISAYTSGTISRESTIRIQLAGNFGDSAKIGQETDVFSFDPSIKGKAHWVDASTIEFKPDKNLPAGTSYEVSFNLEKIIDVPSDLEEFDFEFSTIQQSFEVQYPAFEAIDKQTLKYQRISGTLLTADIEDDAKVEQLLSARQDKTNFKIHWEHAADKRTHRYIVDSLLRKSSESEAFISWDGSPLNLDLKGEHKVIIPALGDFKVMSITLQNQGEQYISIYFSDPILQSQDLNGLIQFSGEQNLNNSNDLRFTISGNEIKCYPGVQLNGQHTISVFPGIKNVLGFGLKRGAEQTLDFLDMKPNVSFVGKGVILPASKKLLLPFVSVGLRSVDVTIVKIYEQNVSQFLQVNDLNTNREMVRVGRPILKKTIKLDTDKSINLQKSNQFAIELDQLIRTEPGAVYNVKISYKKAYSTYRCSGTEETTAKEDDMQSVDEENWDGGEVPENSYWDAAEDDYGSDYNWNERDNPCSNSYYNPSRWVNRNIIASDLGIIAKSGSNHEYVIAISDLNTTKPLSGVKVNLLDYQQQIIQIVTTDGDGLAKATANRKPFLLVASYKEQKGYLKLDDGSSLSLSQFDVSGDVVQKGLKGFIYGERGVWRPGDSIYLTFLLEDRNKTLPPMHPVSFELYDPNGVLTKVAVQNKSLNGFFGFRTSTDPSAPTGNWTAKVKVGGVTFQKVLKIETIMPNRLKIDLNFDKAFFSKGDKIITTLKSKWLTGAIADGLNAKVDMTLSTTTTSFPRYAEYAFDDPTVAFSPEEKTIFEGKLDDNGTAKISGEISLENKAASKLNANFVTKVFEPGGNFSIDRFSIPYFPYENMVGFRLPPGDKARGMLLTDTTHQVSVVCLNPAGVLAKGTRKVTVKLYKINWRWWWDRSDENLSSYNFDEEYTPMQNEEIQVVNGVGKWKLRLNYPEWGRYMIKMTDEAGHSSAKAFYMDWPGWAGRAQRDGAVEATMLTFTSDKTSYKVGENVRLAIPSAANGRALVSIENGSQVLETHWVETKDLQTSYSFKVTASMLPNIYVHVTLVQPHANTKNDLPIRLYGMIPLTVTDPTTILQPVIAMANQIRPDEDASIHVSESTGKPMTYTLAVVDEGLLDLTRFKTPDPYAQFYAREALGVKTWDMYDYVMCAFGMQMNRILSIGGDGGINNKAKGNKANRFKPVVKFIGPFHIGSGSTAEHVINIHEYVGSVRVMVVAGENGAYGSTEKTVPVKKPLMVLATLPRVLGPGETCKLPVTLFAMEKNIRKVQVQIVANDILVVGGSSTKMVVFSKPGDEVVDFDIRVKSKLGIGKVKVIASCGAERAEYNVELDVRNPNPIVSNVYDGQALANQNWSSKYSLVGITGTNTATLEVSSIPALNLESRLRYLIQYPHGCVEQTTSAVFPQIALNELLDLNQGWKNQIEYNVRAGIQKLKSFQTPEGGLSYWPGERTADDWASSYAGHFCIVAQNLGYSLPVGFLANWKRYQRNAALSWTRDEYVHPDLIQAYRLYTLALAKAPELGAMNRLKELKGLTTGARWRLAAAYVLVGQTDVAKELIRSLPLKAVASEQNPYTFGSDERDEALILETLVLIGDKVKAGIVLQSVATRLGTNQWMSTQSTAYSLLAIAGCTGKFADNKTLDFTYTINGKQGSYRSNAKIAQIPVNIEGRATGNVQVHNSTGQLLYTRLITHGQPEVGDQTSANNNLKLSVVYKDMNDNTLDEHSIPQGTDFQAQVTIEHPGTLGAYEQMALSQIFPSGWEIINTRMDPNSPFASNYQTPRYQDIRDDRVYSYFSLKTSQKVTYVVLLNASYLGKFYLPSLSCEEMYLGNINARIGGTWVEVVPRVVPKIVASK